jgi:curved DNA-binding protein CbpA
LSDARTRTPKPVEGRGHLRDAPLSPTDGFILSRIDGVSDEQEIIAVTGLSVEQVQASLAKLESLGVVTFERSLAATPYDSPGFHQSANAPSGSDHSAARAANEPSGSDRATRAADVTPSSPVSPAPPASAGPALVADEQAALAEDVDLNVEMRRRILDKHDALERVDHYALLDVDSTADRKTLRRAYFELAAQFHPDRYFRKKLGSFKPRMETIFGRLTMAHETLSNKDSRAEYDAYLEEQRRARGIEQLLADAALEAERAEESIEREARAQTSLASPVPAAPPASLGGTPAPAAVTGPRARAATLPNIDMATRRDTLARRLLGGRGPATSSAPPPRTSISPAPSPSVTEAMDALRRRYEERVARAKAVQTRKYVANAEAALAQGDPVAAANAFRVARGLSPADPELERMAHEAQEKADAVLSQTYTRQATYEEKTGQWAGAARSWTRVCNAQPNDPDAHDHAANALLKAGGDLHEAGRFADRACAIEPRNPRYRLTLANVYLAAGLSLNALRELETAAQLAPQDGTIQAMIERIGR